MFSVWFFFCAVSVQAVNHGSFRHARTRTIPVANLSYRMSAELIGLGRVMQCSRTVISLLPSFPLGTLESLH